MDALNSEFFDYIHENSGKDPIKLRLSEADKRFSFPLNFALTQIEARKKFKTKLSAFLENPYFLFPDIVSGEQASHQAIARYHADLIPTAAKVLDMTAGLGIDALSIAKNNNKITSIELNPLKADILKRNAETIGVSNIEVKNDDSIAFLNNTKEKFDIIFIDPSRRDTDNKRLYNLAHCSPDIIENINLLLNSSPRVLIKASPLLDITQTIKDLKHIASISAVGVKGECKELLIELDISKTSVTPDLIAVDLDPSGNVKSIFKIDGDNYIDKNEEIVYASFEELREGTFVLEPSAMMMKIAPWAQICDNFNAKKLDKSSNLFIAESYPDNFPGRVTILSTVITKKDRKSIEGLPASAISKNHPLSSDELRKTFKLKEGDSNFLYASKICGKPVIFLSKSVQK